MFLENVIGELPRLRGLAVFASVVSSYVLGTVVYRLYFHPLAGFPGPFWARISTFPSWWHTRNCDRHVWLLKLQEKYGPSFRYTPDSVVINTPSGYKSIYNKEANVRKSESYYKSFTRSLDRLATWSTTDKKAHARKRRVLNNAFSEKAVRSAEGFIHSNLDRWCELIRQQIGPDDWTPSLNMAHWSDYLIFDILGDLCFGKSFDMKEADSQLRHIPEIMIGYLSLMHPIGFSPFAKLWLWLKPRGLDQLFETVAPPTVKNWQLFVEKCFSERAKLEDDLQRNPKSEAEIRKDFFHFLTRAVDPLTGQGYSREEMYGENEALIIAGADTTSIALAAFFFYLTHFPAAQEKLAREVADKFSSLDEIRGGPALHSCEYLRAFIDETLRMSPAVAAELSREVCEGGIEVEGHFFPPGLRVSTSAYCMHYNDDIYRDPFHFRPERWIVAEKASEGSAPDEVALAQSGFCAFSTGPRNCVGKNLAYLEMSIILAKIVYQFKVRRDLTTNLGGGSPDAPDGRRHPDQFQVYDIFVSKRDGPMVQLSRRHHA